MYSLIDDFPELIKLFLDYLFANISSEDVQRFFGERYLQIISEYIIKCNSGVEFYLEKLNNLEEVLIDIKQVTKQLKVAIENLEDDEVKSALLINPIFTITSE